MSVGDGDGVRAFPFAVNGARRPLILFAPGAGAPSSSPWMTRWARRLATVGDVTRFDYPYMRDGRRAPDKLPVLVSAHREALTAARAAARKRRIVLAGKSMGSRVGCHLALEEPIDAIVCLGYPLRGMRGELRDEVLLALRRPILFVQGTRAARARRDAGRRRRSRARGDPGIPRLTRTSTDASAVLPTRSVAPSSTRSPEAPRRPGPPA